MRWLEVVYEGTEVPARRQCVLKDALHLMRALNRRPSGRLLAELGLESLITTTGNSRVSMESRNFSTLPKVTRAASAAAARWRGGAHGTTGTRAPAACRSHPAAR